MSMSATTTLFLSMAAMTFIVLTMRRFIAKKREIIAPSGGRLARWAERLKSSEWRRYGLVLAAELNARQITVIRAIAKYLRQAGIPFSDAYTVRTLIERAGGAYYLVDMGSTNGVVFEGERIARKEIVHGDRFRIGDHELEFLFG